MVNFNPLTKKVIGAHVDPPAINTAHAVWANVTAFGTRYVATSGILTHPFPKLCLLSDLQRWSAPYF